MADSATHRQNLSFSAAEKVLQEQPYIYSSATVTLSEKSVGSVFYQAWADGRVESKNVDLIWCHGLGDYGGRLSEFVSLYLSAGIRVVAIDLPSHGRSSGRHALIPDVYALPRAIKEVVTYITTHDNPNPANLKESRKVFVGGGSLGGWTALEYGLNPTPNIAGIIAWCPMIYTVGESTPNILVQVFARLLIKAGLGWLPLVAANRGKSSTPEMEALFLSDPQTYHGNLRVATGLQLLDGMNHIRANMGQFKMPVLMVHGKGDRVTEWQGSEEFYALCGSMDRELALFDGMQHDLLREKDTDLVICRTRDWILARSK